MDRPTLQAETPTIEAIDPEEAHLNPEQRELLRSFERSLHQSETGQYRPLSELVAELRAKRLAEDRARLNDR